MPIASTSLPDLAATPQGMPLATFTITGLARSLLLPKSLVRPCSKTTLPSLAHKFAELGTQACLSW